jgi:hypothetical protein
VAGAPQLLQPLPQPVSQPQLLSQPHECENRARMRSKKLGLLQHSLQDEVQVGAHEVQAGAHEVHFGAHEVQAGAHEVQAGAQVSQQEDLWLKIPRMRSIRPGLPQHSVSQPPPQPQSPAGAAPYAGAGAIGAAAGGGAAVVAAGAAVGNVPIGASGAPALTDAVSNTRTKFTGVFLRSFGTRASTRLGPSLAESWPAAPLL